MKKFLFLFLLLVITLVACANEKESTKPMDHSSSGLAVDESLEGLAYNMEKDAWSPMMVQFLGEVDDKRVQGAYEIAIEYADVLEYMPCYCGCFESNGHESNKHCFVDEFDKEVVKLDSMGFSCGICIDIANAAVEKYKNGESLKEIRQYIDNTYGGNGIGPTPTPMPKG